MKEPRELPWLSTLDPATSEVVIPGPATSPPPAVATSAR